MSYKKFGQFYTKKQFYGTTEIADILGRHPITITRWLKKGRLLGTKIEGRWFIKVKDFNEFVNKFSNKDEFNRYYERFWGDG